MKQSLETCDYYTVSIETKGYSWNSFGRKENEMLIIQQFYSNSISLLKSQEFTGLTLSTHLFIIKIDTQGTLYFLPFIFRDFCWWQWRQHWGWGRWIRRTFFPKWWDLSTIPRKSQLLLEKRVNEVFNLHFFLDFLPTSPSLSNHESNTCIIYYEKWYIITYGLKTVQQPGFLDFKAYPQGLVYGPDTIILGRDKDPGISLTLSPLMSSHDPHKTWDILPIATLASGTLTCR